MACKVKSGSSATVFRTEPDEQLGTRLVAELVNPEGYIVIYQAG